MTDRELHGIARQALNMARTEQELTGWKSSIVLAWYRKDQDPPLHRMRMIEDLLQARLGGGWLNSGRGKDLGFYMLRLAVEAMRPEAVALCTPTNMFKSTAKGAAQLKSRGGGVRNVDPRSNTPEGRREMVAEGLLELADSITAVVQTPERVCWVMQPVERGVFAGKLETQFFDQAGFDGRGKMYGGELSEDDRKEAARFRETLIGAGLGELAGEEKECRTKTN